MPETVLFFVAIVAFVLIACAILSLCAGIQTQLARDERTNGFRSPTGNDRDVQQHTPET